MSHSNKIMNRYSSRNDWYEDPSEAQELGKNWCVSVPYHELWLMEDTKKLAKASNSKSTAQYIRNVLKRDIRQNRRILEAIG